MDLLSTRQGIAATSPDGAAAIWRGRPVPGFRIRSSDWVRLVTGLVLLAFAAFWTKVVLLHAHDAQSAFVFTVIEALIVFIGGKNAGPALLPLFLRPRTSYALTADGFAVIAVNGFPGQTQQIYLPELDAIQIEPANGSVGSIVFGSIPEPRWYERRYVLPRLPAFEFIDGVSDVYDLCTKLQTAQAQ